MGEALLLTLGLFKDDLLGEPGRDRVCEEGRLERGIAVEYEGGGCNRGVTKDRQDTKRASND